MIDVVHEKNIPLDFNGCGGLAFRLRCRLEDVISETGIVLDSSTLVYDDGREIIDDDGVGRVGTLIVCQSCGEPVHVETFGDRAVAMSGGVSFHVG